MNLATMLELRYKPIEQHEHDPFNVGSFSMMLSTDSPSARARPVYGSTLFAPIYPTIYTTMANSTPTFKLFFSSATKNKASN
jgi:hypothetical protein